MKILITGGAGFLGSEIVNSIINKEKNVKITVIDNLSRGYLYRIKDNLKKIKFYKADVANINNLKLKKFDWIFHCSAIAPLPDNQSCHYKSISENIAQCGAIVDFCINSGSEKIIFFSSSAIYEKVKSVPFREKKLVAPILMYPTSKYLAEEYFKSIALSYKIKIISLRLANIYGRNQDYFRKQLPFLGYLIKNTISQKVLKLYAKGDFKRDYLFVDDLVELIIKIIHSKKISFKSHFFNVGSGKSYSVPDFIRIIKKVSGIQPRVIWQKKTNYWMKYPGIYKSKIKLKKELIKQEVEKKVFLDSRKVMKFFNWKPKITIEQGLKECFYFAQKKFFKK